MTGTLYLIPNRISNAPASDVLPARTVQTAQRVRRFLAENAKSARAFLKEIAHPGPIAELEIVEIGHDPDVKAFDTWLAPVTAGIDTAVVSESGCPGVADPGAGLTARAQALGIPVVPLVGPCSILLTLMASGMNGQNFRFVGYLPVDEVARAAAVRSLEKASLTGETQLFIETPYRNNRMLASLLEILSPRTRLTVATDVSGADESIISQEISVWRKIAPTLPKLPTVFALSANPNPQGHDAANAVFGTAGLTHEDVNRRKSPALHKPNRSAKKSQR